MPARKHLREESGYSLVEVMVSIMILTIAILPLMSMFDTGMHGAITNSQYDKARTLANLKMEQAKNLPFANVESNFPFPEADPPIGTPYDDPDTWLPGNPVPADGEFEEFTGLEYRVVKDYMKQPPTDTTEEDQVDPSEDFVECNLLNDCEPPTNLIRVAITVRWSNGDSTNTYTTFGLVAR